MSNTSGLPYTASDDDVELARAMRENAQREVLAARARVETEAVPLWDRLRLRQKQNSFGEEYELSLIPRRSA